MDPRRWMLVSMIVQLIGFGYDAVWHGYLNPDFEAVTVNQMVGHLSTVHLPIYIGVLGLLVSTAWALVDQARRGRIGVALPAALIGSLIQTAGETWHAWTHLQLSPRGAGPAMLAFAGLVVVVAALLFGGRSPRRRTEDDVPRKRPA